MLRVHHAIFWHCVLSCTHGLGKYLTAKYTLVGSFWRLAAIDSLIYLVQGQGVEQLLQCFAHGIFS